MSRIIVVPDFAEPQLEGCPVLMNEEVRPEHLQNAHSADQLIERVPGRSATPATPSGKPCTTRQRLLTGSCHE